MSSTRRTRRPVSDSQLNFFALFAEAATEEASALLHVAAHERQPSLFSLGFDVSEGNAFTDTPTELLTVSSAALVSQPVLSETPPALAEAATLAQSPSGEPAVPSFEVQAAPAPETALASAEEACPTMRASRPQRVTSLPTDPAPSNTLARDYRWMPDSAFGTESPAEKLTANLRALRTLQALEVSGLRPTLEQAHTLARYHGWGALAKVFDPAAPPRWQEANKELQTLLTPEEYASARASTPSAHFTPPAVAEWIWAALERVGFRSGGTVLEPSLGLGVFFGLMPETLLPGTRRVGVEKDLITTRLARLLYPDSTIHTGPFEATTFAPGSFDLAVGNVPFGDYGVHDPTPAFRRRPHLLKPIHDYFLAKSLSYLRPGGLLAVLTHRGTLDKEGTAHRRHLQVEARLLAAYRLPNTAFAAAGTGVVTDFLLLEKR